MEAEREMSKQTNKDKLRLEKVNMDNWVPLVRLKVKRDQQSFVASNVGSLAEAYVATISGGYPQPFGIYRGDKPIGFLMVGYYPSLEYAKKYSVRFIHAPEDRILEAKAALAKKGVYCEHTTAANYAAYLHYCEKYVPTPDTLITMCGAGLKSDH